MTKYFFQIFLINPNKKSPYSLFDFQSRNVRFGPTNRVAAQMRVYKRKRSQTPMCKGS